MFKNIHVYIGYLHEYIRLVHVRRQWLALLPHMKRRLRFLAQGLPVWGLHTPCVCLGSLWPLWLPPRVQKQVQMVKLIGRREWLYISLCQHSEMNSVSMVYRILAP